jgi:ferrous iron transport protein A
MTDEIAAFHCEPLLIINRIMNMSSRIMIPVSLEALPRRQHATVAAIDWERLAVPEARRLRELGFDEGVHVEVLHRARLGRGPIACRIGRMTVALRRAVAGAIHVSPLAG